MVIFFSSFISMLYYLGVMQALIRVIARAMQALMATTAGESLNAAGNIFIGQVCVFRPLRLSKQNGLTPSHPPQRTHDAWQREK